VERGVLDATDLPEDRYDLIVDSYVSCHLLANDERLGYLDGLMALLNPGGCLYTSCMGSDDEYYAKFRDLTAEGLATDPLNGVTKLLQPAASFSSRCEPVGRIIGSTRVTFPDVVRGTTYQREVVAATVAR
jgi:hypothetical protein